MAGMVPSNIGRAPEILLDHRPAGGEARATAKNSLHFRNESNGGKSRIFRHTARTNVLGAGEGEYLGQSQDGIGEPRAGGYQFGGITIAPGRRVEEIADLRPPQPTSNGSW
jgi:hypothetical protein